MGQCRNICVDCGNIHAVFVGESARGTGVDRFWNPVGDCDIRRGYENS